MAGISKHLILHSIFLEVDMLHIFDRRGLEGIDIAEWSRSRQSLGLGKCIDLKCPAIVLDKRRQRIEGRTILVGIRRFCL